MPVAYEWLWLCVVVLAVLLEVFTAQLVSIWFVAGGFAALIASLCGAQLWLQVVLFLAVTAITLILTRPLVRRVLDSKKVKTNADRYVGMTAVVTSDINNNLGIGLVNVEGSVWSARSVDGVVIAKGDKVRICEIRGVKLMVAPLGEEENK